MSYLDPAFTVDQGSNNYLTVEDRPVDSDVLRDPCVLQWNTRGGVAGNKYGVQLIHKDTPGYGYSAIDFVIELVEPLPPSITCPPAQTITADNNCLGSQDFTTLAVISDPANTAVVVTASPAGPYVVGATNVTLTATNALDLTASCTLK